MFRGDRTGRPLLAGERSGADFWCQHHFVRRLAVGLMTEVLLVTAAEPEGRGRMMAVKCVASGCVGEPRVEALFAEEANLAARLSHPNVVSVLGVCRDRDGRLCLVMEYVDGPTLEELARKGPLPFAAAIHIASKVLTGLGYAHEKRLPRGQRGLAHCDIAPENALLSRDGSVKITDFGMARTLPGQATVPPRVLKQAQASYASPEQLNEQAVDGRSDLFAVGAVLWELLAGVPLFTKMTAGEVAARVNLHPLPRPGTRRPCIPHDLEDVVMRLLARNAQARYQTAAEAIADLAGCADAPCDGPRALAQVIAKRTARGSRRARDGQLRPEAGAGDRAGCGALYAAARAVPLNVLLDVPRREPRDYSLAEYRALLDALERSAFWNRSRDLALAHVLYHCGLTIATAVGLDIGQLHLGRRVFLDVRLPESSEPRDVPFNDVVYEALEQYVWHRRSRIRSDGSNALFLWDQGTRLPVDVAHVVMRCRPRK